MSSAVLAIADQVINAVDAAMDCEKSDLARAFARVGQVASDKGTCLLVETSDGHESVIAGPNWPFDLRTTMHRKNTLAIVDFRDQGCLSRVTMLAAPINGAKSIGAADYKLVIAALDAIEAIVEIAISYNESMVVSDVARRPTNTAISMPAE